MIEYNTLENFFPSIFLLFLACVRLFRETVKITDGDNVIIIIKVIYSIPFDISCLHLIDQTRQNPTKSFSTSLSSTASILSISNSNEPIRYPIKPRTMTQAPIPTVESAFLDTPSDGDLTITHQCKILAMHGRR